VFNNGQHVQWIAPWKWLPLLNRYRDRDGGNNWVHIYNDWAQLKARHAVQPRQPRLGSRDATLNDEQRIAAAILENYFDHPDSPDDPLRCSYDILWDDPFEGEEIREELFGSDPNSHTHQFIDWVNDLIEVGWHLCRPYKSGATIAAANTAPPSESHAA
jgi:CRISPR-associated protein Cmr2